MNRRLLKKALLLGAGLVVLAGCPRTERESPILARVNGEAVRLADLERERAFQGVFPGGEIEEAASDKDLLEGVIDQVLVRQRAVELEMVLGAQEAEDLVALATRGAEEKDLKASLARAGLTLSGWKERLRLQAQAEAAFRRDNMDRLVITRQQVKDHYWQNVTRYRYAARVLLRQIVCESREKAEAAQAELRLGDPFEEVVRRYSKGPEASRGGLVGWLRRRDLPAELADTAFKLRKGTVSEVLESPYGFHLLRVDEKRRAVNHGVEEASPKVREQLRERLEEKLYKEWLFELRRRARIERLAVEQGPAREGKE